MSRGLGLLLVLLAGCSDDAAAPADGGPGPTDAGVDAPVPDAGPPDAGPPPPSRAAEAPLIQWVDPFIGTGGDGFGVGSVNPGPQRPFGFARPGPDTSTNSGAVSFYHCSGYWYGDDFVRGFSQTRMHGTGIVDYLHVALMPTVGMSAEKTTEMGYRSRFSHDDEEASPGYYAVGLMDTGIRAELTATERVSLHRYTFPATAGAEATVLVDVGHSTDGSEVSASRIEIDPAVREVSGWSHVVGGYSNRHGGERIYFVARFSRAFEAHGIWRDATLSPGATAGDGPQAGAWVTFDATAETGVIAAVGISFVDVAHARMNLDAEAAALDFDTVRTDAEAAWEQLLGRIEIEGRSEEFFRIFYTALYHTLLMPTLASDVDGSYRGFDGEVHVMPAGERYYTDFSLWDTFRTLHPFLTLVYPEWQNPFLRSLNIMAREGGYMPRWPLGTGYTGGMIGESATVTFADSYVKGVRDWDLREAYDAMRLTAMELPPPGAPYGGRGGLVDYLALGYVPIESGSSVSETQEYAYDDWALAILAEALGETADATMFRARGENWRNVFDPAQRFMVGRHRDGTFAVLEDRFEWLDDYVEGNAWQWLWYAPHDLDGLAEVFGGRDTMFETLDEFFAQSEGRPRTIAPDRYHWQGNEIDLHTPWIYAALDSPDRTARWSRWVLATRYSSAPEGIPGNDDGGTMSAWYLFGALGFYPIAGEDHYLVGSPLVTHATVHLPDGDLVIDAPESSDAVMYVGSAMLDGAALDRARIPHATIADGAELRLQMTATPAGWAEMAP